ncbi:DsbA family protein [Halorubellus sp. PRR65]|uniref:DsbA family protein n=1 Tax=Halorubellus sp. PRR65 TaxID=3098148 RepID=UPI002B2599DD|nr:DsbA family protein [Halorubellus sp. PRR65]
MGGGDKGKPPISTPSSDEEGPATVDEDEESQQTGLPEQVPKENPDESDDEESGVPSTPPTSVSTGGGSPGDPPVTPPPTETPESPPEEPEECEEGESEPPEPTSEEQTQEPEFEQPEDVDDSEEDDDDDEEDEQQASVVIHSDAWDNVGLGLYPIRYQLQEEYGDQIEFEDRLVPMRSFESPQSMPEKWGLGSQRHGMPVDSSIWSRDPPESTEVSNRAFAAARIQSLSLADEYMRRLRIAAIVEGRNIENRSTALELAAEVGLDPDQLKDDWDEVDVQKSRRDVEVPETTIHIDGRTVSQQGYLHIDDLKMIFEQAGLDEGDPQDLVGFVDEYGPVATKEVQQVYGLSRNEAMERLRNNGRVRTAEYGDATLWTTVN